MQRLAALLVYSLQDTMRCDEQSPYSASEKPHRRDLLAMFESQKNPLTAYTLLDI